MLFRNFVLNIILVSFLLGSIAEAYAVQDDPDYSEKLKQAEIVRIKIYKLPKEEQIKEVRQVAHRFIELYEAAKNSSLENFSYRNNAKPKFDFLEGLKEAEEIVFTFNLSQRTSSNQKDSFQYGFKPGEKEQRTILHHLALVPMVIFSMISIFIEHPVKKLAFPISLLLIGYSQYKSYRHQQYVFGQERTVVNTKGESQTSYLPISDYGDGNVLYKANDPVWDLFFAELRKHFGKEMPRTKKARYPWLLEKIGEMKNSTAALTRIGEITKETQRVEECENPVLPATQDNNALKAEEEAIAEAESTTANSSGGYSEIN